MQTNEETQVLMTKSVNFLRIQFIFFFYMSLAATMIAPYGPHHLVLTALCSPVPLIVRWTCIDSFLMNRI